MNADKFILTGAKEEQKRYYRVTGYIGNMKTFTVADMKKKTPGKMMEEAVRGMLPKNRLQDKFMARLKVYTGSEHPHENAKFKSVI